MAANLYAMDLQKLQCDNSILDMFMKFDQTAGGCNQEYIGSENCGAHNIKSTDDIKNLQWSALAGIILSSSKSNSLTKLISRIDKFRDEFGDDGSKNVSWRHNETKVA
jgi:hypothetical protein